MFRALAVKDINKVFDLVCLFFKVWFSVFQNSKEVVILGKIRTLWDFLGQIIRFRVAFILNVMCVGGYTLASHLSGLLKVLIQLRVNQRSEGGWGGGGPASRY